MKLTTKMIRGTEKAECENTAKRPSVQNVKDALALCLEYCPSHYTDAECSLKLHISKSTVRLMKELYATLQ